ncbi:protein TIC 55, chloroplastic-like [Magnolia sinica]|uniref:protein TIC 55, chloroplastic-like n=1 Tax=Magnolia sinica TaxID=86752 RepID=UPI00265A0E8B|nr:protein TIC 55, chloroplastic-like [Magnolia sinica]
MVIMRFGASTRPFLFKLVPSWYYHQNASKVLEQDKGFLASQNEVLMKGKVPTKGLYLNLRSSDTSVAQYRKWMDSVGHGMPYYIGQNTISLPKDPAVVEHTPAGLIAGISASTPAKGRFGTMHVPKPTNRYFRHIVHCKGCRNAVKAFRACKNMLSILSVASAALAVLASARQWKVLLLALATVFLAGAYAFASQVSLNTTNFIRKHRRL